MMKSSKRVVFLLLILAVANTTVYGVPYIKDTYYDLMMKTMSLSHAEMGVLCSAYGIVATFSYLLGGIVADKWSLRKQIMISLVIMGALDWMFSIKLSFKAGIIVMGLMGVFSILTFYPALIKLIFGLGVHCGQGKAFGIFNSGVNVVSLFFICLTVMIFNRAGQNTQVFYVIVRCYAIVNFIGAFGVWRWMEESRTDEGEKETLGREEIQSIFLSKNIWMIAFMVLCYYTVNSCLAYINPYLLGKKYMSEDAVYLLSVFRMGMLVFAIAPVVGRYVDRKGTSLGMIRYGFTVLSFSFLILGTVLQSRRHVLAEILAVIMISGVIIALRMIVYIPVYEMDIPENIQGTVIGVVSFVGYLPDSFYYTAMGGILDTFVDKGYSILFLVSALFSVLGFFAANALWKNIDNECTPGISKSKIV